MIPKFNCRVEMKNPPPSLLTWSQKDFSDKFYTILTNPELTDWLLKQKNCVWYLNIFIWWEGSTSYVRIEWGSNSKHILLLSWFLSPFGSSAALCHIFCDSSSAIMDWNTDTFGYPSLQHWMAVIPTTLSSAIWPVKASTTV